MNTFWHISVSWQSTVFRIFQLLISVVHQIASSSQPLLLKLLSGFRKVLLYYTVEMDVPNWLLVHSFYERQSLLFCQELSGFSNRSAMLTLGLGHAAFSSVRQSRLNSFREGNDMRWFETTNKWTKSLTLFCWFVAAIRLKDQTTRWDNSSLPFRI